MSCRCIPSTRILLSALIVTAVLAGAARVRGAEPEALPTSQELHKLFDDGQYQPLLNKLARVLQLKGPAARPYDRVDLELLKADALLELKQTSGAIAAAQEAVKAITEQTDDKLSARARATAVLFKRMQTFSFTAKTAVKGQPAPQPIDLLDVSKRKDAFVALLPDVQTEVTARARAVKSVKSLPPIIEAIRAVADLHAVEVMAEDTSNASEKLADDLATQAKELIGDSVGTMDKRVKVIDDDANALQPIVTGPQNTRTGTGVSSRSGPTGSGAAQIGYQKRGLNSNAKTELKNIIDTCEKIVAISRDFAEVSKSSAAGFKTIGDAAANTAKAANTTLTADYSGVKNSPKSK